MKDNKLEVGDILYKNGSCSLNRMKVTRLTPKQAVLDPGYKCSNEIKTITRWNNESVLAVKAVGEYGYYYIQTAELDLQYHKQYLKSRLHTLLSNMRTTDIPEDEHETAIAFLSKYKGKKE